MTGRKHSPYWRMADGPGRVRRIPAGSTLRMCRRGGSTWVDGPMTVPLAKRLDCKYQRNPVGRGWLVPAAVTDDFEALAQHLGVAVEWVLVA
jgi:hypothetical protein